MKNICLLGKGNGWILAALFILVGLFAAPATAQKIKNDKLRTTYYKTPLLALTPKYSSYSIEYDCGDRIVLAGEWPQLSSLEFKKADGDLNLKMRVKSVYSADKVLKLDQSDGKQRGYYNVTYKADYGYDLVDKASGNVIASYKRAGGVFSTPSFDSKTEMNMYMKNALESDLIKYLVEKVNDRVSYDLVPNKYAVRLVANTVEGTAPAYQEIYKASANLWRLLPVPNPIKKNYSKPPPCGKTI
ncbi:hypothetical protein AHMF7605_21450 [Adhaeribacter arboris]|uniref:Uncharacterized protein n=1 Tax=Adhaeribacter arboris TaxID=2072846 RepID=A0A2T2YK52_9BACT|nr:hypothetical protein [Adhaeribacter arboris]PSR55882.1 hypothetical protein AHMF7605_21450 [Adhaeribacter arboris]